MNTPEQQAPSILPDLRTLADHARSVSDWANYLEQASQLHVSNLQFQISSLQQEEATLHQEHKEAIDAVNRDYARKVDRCRAMQQQISEMVSFYLKAGDPVLVAPDARQIPPYHNYIDDQVFEQPQPREKQATWLGRLKLAKG